MKTWCSILICLACQSLTFDRVNPQENWPQFRGINAMGVSKGNPPIEWNVDNGKNIKWKKAIDGLGHSAPIVWGDKLFLTTAVSQEQKAPTLSTGWKGAQGEAAPDKGKWTWKVICLDRNSGKEIWSRETKSGVPAIQRHMKASHANCSPVTNGESVVAFFGSEGLYCYDFSGNLKWQKDFGRLHSGPYNAKELEWGFASSPIIYQDFLIVQCDCLNTGFICVLDLRNGKEIRRIKREDVATWSTPCVFEWKGKTQIVCNGFKEMAGYDLESGEKLWTLSGGGDVPVPTPLFYEGLVYISNSHAGSHCFAISPSAQGDITPKKDEKKLPEGLVWHAPRGGSYMPTPIIVDGLHYTCSDRGILTVRKTDTGEEVYKKRVSGQSYTASAVATKDRVYFAAENGNIYVVATGVIYKELSVNRMNEIIMSTPTIAGDSLFIRTSENLYCIAEGKKREKNE